MADRDHSYCPGGPDSDFEYSTQSYTGYEVGSFRYLFGPRLTFCSLLLCEPSEPGMTHMSRRVDV